MRMGRGGGDGRDEGNDKIKKDGKFG